MTDCISEGLFEDMEVSGGGGGGGGGGGAPLRLLLPGWLIRLLRLALLWRVELLKLDKE